MTAMCRCVAYAGNPIPLGSFIDGREPSLLAVPSGTLTAIGPDLNLQSIPVEA